MVDEAIAGYLKLNIGHAQSEDMGDNSLEIERIYVCKTFQRRGLGRVFVDEAVLVAAGLAKSKVWLGVWEHNENAIAFYQKMGFNLTGTSHDFYLGTDRQTDLLMARNLG
jgi:ribosomal protein S18 acetylase RimI-like enzyme